VGISEVTIDGKNASFTPTASGWVRLLSSEFNIAVVFSAGSLGQKHFFPDVTNGDNVRDDRRLKYLCREKNRRKGREFVVEQLKDPRVIGDIERLTDRLLIDGTIRFV